MRELSLQEIDLIGGANCYYGGQQYSPGSVISNPAGGYLQCNYSNVTDSYNWSQYNN